MNPAFLCLRKYMNIKQLANRGGKSDASSVRSSRSRIARRKPFISLSLAVLAATFAACLCCACDPDTDQAPPADQPLTTKSVPADSLAADGLLHYGAIAIDTTWAGEEHYTY